MLLVGTQCHILENRPRDIDTNGLNRWTFSTLAFWGESPKGTFIIDIFDKVDIFNILVLI